MSLKEGTQIQVAKSSWVMQVCDHNHECYLFQPCGQIYTIEKIFKEHVIAIGQSGRHVLLTLSDLLNFNILSK